uniref:Uncharacterized protein n=1 Tax=Chenopodium quinoa TaxID=63459 RepID=A0A803MXA7_CHEQI
MLGEKDKPKRGPTMCYNVHRRCEEERLEITLNEHGQPVGPDDKTCNEFNSFLGTIARKANILPLTVKNWPILRNEKKEELWDYIMDELQDSEKDVDSVISTLIGSNNKKKSPLNFYGRGVSSTQLKQKALMNEVEEKHAREVETLQKDYEDKRLQDRRDIDNGLNSLISQLQQQNPQMSFDLSMFGSLFLDNQCEKDGNTAKKFLLHSSASTSEETVDKSFLTNLEDLRDKEVAVVVSL